MLVSLLQHPQSNKAPAYIVSRSGCKSDEDRCGSIPEGLLGVLPHSIRGQLSSFDHILPATERFTNCIACSEVKLYMVFKKLQYIHGFVLQKVLDEFRLNGKTFLNNVFDSTKYLEDLTGINESFHYRDDDAVSVRSVSLILLSFLLC